MADYNTYWGDTHDNTIGNSTNVHGEPDGVLERARSHLDFLAAGYYTCHAEAFEDSAGHVTDSDGASRIVLEDWKDPERIEREWAGVRSALTEFNEPGSFVTFYGYEWHGDGTGGDHNVSSPEADLPVFRVDSLGELYSELRGWGRPSIAIPHHVAYRPGRRGKDWSVNDEELSPYCEIYSVHGCSETDEEWNPLRRNPHMGPAHAGGTWQDALDAGLHVGCVGSVDNWGPMPGHYGRGKAAVLATELTREALWEAMRARRVYAVTGDRIEVDFRVGDAVMGEITSADGPRKILVKVRGSDAIDRIELLRGSRVIATHCHQGTWDVPAPGTTSNFKVRIEYGWGPRPQEIRTPDRRWTGEMTVAGGRMLSAEPCWVYPGSKMPALKGGHAGLDLVSSTCDLSFRWQNSVVLEFEADAASAARVGLNGLEEAATVAELCRGSREMWYRDECIRMLHETAGIEPGSPAREDIYHHVAHKVKIHRCMPEAAYTARLDYEDDEKLDGETLYRVRVEQRNGEKAWSSPIWVRP